MKTIPFNRHLIGKRSGTKSNPPIEKLGKVINLTESMVDKFKGKRVYAKNDIYIYEVTKQSRKPTHPDNTKHYEVFKKMYYHKKEIVTDERNIKHNITKITEIYPFTAFFNRFAYCTQTLENAILLGEIIVFMNKYEEEIKNDPDLYTMLNRKIKEITISRPTNKDLEENQSQKIS